MAADQTIRYAIKTGRLDKSVLRIKNRTFINWKLADKEWEESTDNIKSEQSAGKLEEDLFGKPDPKEIIVEPENGSLIPTFATSRAKSETMKAELAELDLKKKKGQLVDRGKVEKEAFALAKKVREAIMNVPSRLSAQLAAMKDRSEVESMLEKELRTALEELCHE